MPIFDTHVYLESYPLPGVNQNAEQVAQVMANRGISNAVLFSQRALQVDPLSGNHILKAMIEPYPALFGAVVAHTSRIEASVQAIRDILGSKRFVGTLLVGKDIGHPLHPILSDEILIACRRYQKPIFLLTPNAACVEVGLSLAKAYSMHRFVFLGMGGQDWQNAIAAAHQATNILLETSGVLDMAKLPAAIEAIGAHRILFGSGAPYHDPVATLGLLAEAGVTANNLQRILFSNATKLFALSE
ncbi:MAG: amidohydrolase family protein [Armatimonadetes bacterium]|nr:amidohydrolase family protein [Armatimonadota bacterium]